MPIPVVAAILIDPEGRILIARRRPGKAMAGKWEFPGGKMEDGESEEDALKREIKEEFDVEVHPHERVGAFVHHYPRGSIELIAWKCSFVARSFQLNDHDQIAWVQAQDLQHYDLAEADLPVVSAICKD